MMHEFIRSMRYSGTTWQVCHDSHYLVKAEKLLWHIHASDLDD